MLPQSDRRAFVAGPLWLMVMATSLTGVAAEATSAQPTLRRMSETKVAVVDVVRVIRSSKSFRQKIERLRREIENVKRQARKHDEKLRLRIRCILDEMGKLEKGTPAYAELEAKLAAEKMILQIDTDPPLMKFPEFAAQESAIYAAVYGQFRTAVEDYAKRHDIRLVLRHDVASLSVDGFDAACTASLREGVLWANAVDITDAVIELMEVNSEKPTAATSTCGSPLVQR